MSAEENPFPAFQALIDSLAGWLKHLRELNEMHELSRSDLDRIASELRVSPNELEELVCLAAAPRKQEQLGIDDERLRAYPPLARDMERVCTYCRHNGDCKHNLVSGTAIQRYQDHCPHAFTLETLERHLGTKH